MHDNYEAPVQIRAEVPWLNTSSPCTGSYDLSDPCFVAWQTTGTGPYASSGGLFFTYRSSVSWDSDSDLFFLSLPGLAADGFYPGYSNSTPDPFYWSTSIVRMQTANPAGTVKLRSRDPRVAPAINFNYFRHNAETDLQALSDAVDLMFRVFNSTGVPYAAVIPDPAVGTRQSIMDQSFGHHATSSCRMGPANATGAEACVDSKFRVKGVKGLRVVDASVFPRVPGAMPNGPTFTLSRKAFEVILKGE